MSVRSNRIINEPVWFEKYQRWQIKATKNGERKAFYSSKPGNDGKVECWDRAKKWKEEGIVNDNIKISRLADNWIAELEISSTKSNINNHRQCVKNYLKPLKGNKKIGVITEQDLQDVILHAFKNPIRAKELSAKTLKNLMDSLKAFIKYARKCNVTKLYPENLYIPRTAKKSSKGTLQPNDLIMLFSSDQTSDHNKVVFEWFINAFRYQVASGHRPGEIFGLMKADIKNGICNCKRSINAYGEVTDGKNENAQRTYVIPAIGLEILKAQKDMLASEDPPIKSLYVFPGPDGGPIKPNTYYKHWMRYVAFNNMTRRTPYEIRHTWFSVNKELPIELVKAMGGHGQNFDSMGTYGHALHGEAQKTASLVDQKLRDILKSSPQNPE